MYSARRGLHYFKGESAIASPAIFQQYLRPPESVADYSAALNKTDSGNLDLAAQRQAFTDQNALRSAVQGFGNDPSANLNALQRAGLYKQAQDYQKAIYDNQKTQSDIGLNTAKSGEQTALAGKHTQETQFAAHDKHVQELQGVGTPEDLVNWYADGIKNKTLDPAKSAAAIAALSQDPTQFQALKAQMLQNSVDLKTRFTEEQNNTRNAATNATHVQTTQMANDTTRATNAATNATHVQTTGMTQAGENSRAAAGRAQQLLLGGMNPDGSPRVPATDSATGQIDLTKVAPADLAAAYRYKTDGTLPPNMGRGVQGAGEALRIRTIAAGLDAQGGESPEDARIRQLALKGDVGAINQMRKREVAVGANVKNFDFNADQALQLSSQVDRTGVPIANAWLNAGRRSVTGNPQLSAFDVAVKTTVNEFAQIVSGTTAGATTEGEKKKAETLLNSAQTPEQLMAVINQMKVESKNRMTSFAAQRAEAMPTNAAKPAQPAAKSKTVNFSDLK